MITPPPKKRRWLKLALTFIITFIVGRCIAVWQYNAGFDTGAKIMLDTMATIIDERVRDTNHDTVTKMVVCKEPDTVVYILSKDNIKP